jgi:hypothetical protein
MLVTKSEQNPFPDISPMRFREGQLSHGSQAHRDMDSTQLLALTTSPRPFDLSQCISVLAAKAGVQHRLGTHADSTDTRIETTAAQCVGLLPAGSIRSHRPDLLCKRILIVRIS